MAWQALIPAGIELLKTGFTAFNKPKAQYPEETMNAINKMIANNESDIKSKALLNTLTSAAKSQGAQQYQQSQHSLDILKNRGDLSEGQYTKSLLNAGTDTQSMVGQQTQNAAAEQYRSNRSAVELIDNARLQLAQIKDQYRSQFKAETQQWKNELISGAVDTVATGFNTYMSELEDKKLTGSINQFLNGRDINTVMADPMQFNSLISFMIMLRQGYGGNNAK